MYEAGLVIFLLMFETKKYYYFFEIQYLGYRYHGWQKQKGVKTIQGLLEKALSRVLGHEEFRTLGASRTDAQVSAHYSAFELFTRQPADIPLLQEKLPFYLPPDIKILSIKETEAQFNIIQHPKLKEYRYYFSCGQKNHPFAAPYMLDLLEELDIEMMKQGAKVFEGVHNFQRYTPVSNGKNTFVREIISSALEENKGLDAGFFPENSYTFRIQSRGFLRHQVRLMMGALIELGRGEISLTELKDSLQGGNHQAIGFKVPGAGLVLHHIAFE